MRTIILFITVLISGVLVFGCQDEGMVVNTGDSDPSETQTTYAVNKVGREFLWADDLLFRTIVTPATFKPASDPFDQLYAGAFKDGYGLISESKPGDKDYNGGRWHLNALKDDVPADRYSDASRVEDLDPSDFAATGRYFECPMLPIRGQ